MMTVSVIGARTAACRLGKSQFALELRFCLLGLLTAHTCYWQAAAVWKGPPLLPQLSFLLNWSGQGLCDAVGCVIDGCAALPMPRAATGVCENLSFGTRHE